MEYNTQRSKLHMPEYGRHIQKMVSHAITIKDDEERNKCAKSIISVMGQLNPHLRDVADFKHKLWDHLYIISEFNLDVDSPFETPTPESVNSKPIKIAYPKKAYKSRHYGKTIQMIIDEAVKYEEGEEKNALIRVIANQLKKLYLMWNKDAVSDEQIDADLARMSDGKLKIPEGVKLVEVANIPNPIKRKKRPPKSGGGWHKQTNRRKNYN